MYELPQKPCKKSSICCTKAVTLGIDGRQVGWLEGPDKVREAVTRCVRCEASMLWWEAYLVVCDLGCPPRLSLKGPVGSKARDCLFPACGHAWSVWGVVRVACGWRLSMSSTKNLLEFGTAKLLKEESPSFFALSN